MAQPLSTWMIAVSVIVCSCRRYRIGVRFVLISELVSCSKSCLDVDSVLQPPLYSEINDRLGFADTTTIDGLLLWLRTLVCVFDVPLRFMLTTDSSRLLTDSTDFVNKPIHRLFQPRVIVMLQIWKTTLAFLKKRTKIIMLHTI